MLLIRRFEFDNCFCWIFKFCCTALVHCSGLGGLESTIIMSCLLQKQVLGPKPVSNMSMLPPDDDGLGLDDAFALPAAPSIAPRPKPKPKAERVPKPCAPKSKERVRKNRKQKTRETETEAVQPSGSTSSKPKTEAGQDYSHHATTIPGQCFRCS